MRPRNGIKQRLLSAVRGVWVRLGAPEELRALPGAAGAAQAGGLREQCGKGAEPFVSRRNVYLTSRKATNKYKKAYRQSTTRQLDMTDAIILFFTRNIAFTLPTTNRL